MRKKLTAIIKWVWIAAVLAAAGWYFYSHYLEISTYLGTLSIPRILLSALFLLAGKLLLSDITRLSLKKVGWNISYRDALSITSVSQLGKYLPGGIWHFAGKFGLYKVKGLATRQTTKAMLYENIWLLSSATVVGLLMLAVSSPEVVCDYLPFACGSNLVLAVLTGLPVLWLAGLLLFEKYFFPERKFSLSHFLLVLVEQILIWAFFGFSYRQVFPPQAGFLAQIIGAFSLSWVAGYVAVFAPGGIGIREFLLTLFLGAFFASSEVAIYATIHRLIWVLMEMLLGASSAAFIGLPIKAEQSSAGQD